MKNTTIFFYLHCIIFILLVFKSANEIMKLCVIFITVFLYFFLLLIKWYNSH